MKRRKISFPLILIFTAMLSLALAGCSSKDNRTPQEIIQDAYGNQEFTISFSSETLDKPLEDLKYSANKIPLLPTPQKVGYIFEGWFLDPEFICPYTDDTLLLKMTNITLYPKWSKERFDNNGTYDVKIDGKIIPESVKLGSTTKKYGGYRDFTKQINKEASHIEKDSDNLILKLQYESIVTTPFQSSGSVFDVSVNDKMPSSVRVINKIDSLSDSVKTIFININDWDLSTPLYLNVKWTNYESPELTEANRYDTTTSYVIELSLSEIYGFSQPFVDTSVPLEKGYYLAKSYYRKEDNGESMGSIYNPVYSYLYSDGKENYKLIKQNSPYTGLVADEHPLYTPITDNYYERMIAFVALTTVFDIESRGSEGLIESDFYPETYNGGHYRNTATEFHSDTAKFYNIIDIDKDLSKEYLALTAVSGFMEKGSGMGYIRQILSIDYKNLIKISDPDYKPLEGDAYEYEDSFAFYPGDYADVDQNNLTYDTMKKYGVSFDMPNFYYEADSMNAKYKDRRILSSRVTTTPTNRTRNMKVSDSRGELGEFNVHAEVFDYDERSGKNLYLDRMAPQMFEGPGYNNMLRYNRIIKSGKTLNIGDDVNVVDLFSEKVNSSIDFSRVEFTAYEMNDFKIDFNKKYQIDYSFTFKRDIAIEYKYTDNFNHIRKAIVELRLKDEPKVSTRDDISWKYDKETHHYKTDASTIEGEYIKYPELTYTYGRCKDVRLVDNFYLQEGEYSINPSKAYLFAEVNGVKKLYLPSALTSSIQIPHKNITLVYEINNEYNEKEFIYYDYISDPKKTYQIVDDLGNTIASKEIRYNSEGIRYAFKEEYSYQPVHDKIREDSIRSYKYIEGDYESNFVITHYDIYSNEGNLLLNTYTNSNDACNKINNFLKDKAFGMVIFNYSYGGNVLEVKHPYKLTFDGLDSYKALNYEAFFTDTKYTFSKTKLVGDRTEIAYLSTDMKKIIDGRLVNAYDDFDLDNMGSQIEIEFFAPGLYSFETKYTIQKYYMGNPVKDRLTITYYQLFNVQSIHGDITITYVTDELHPFKGGALRKKVTYNLDEGIHLIEDGKDIFTRNDFYPGRRDDILLTWNTRTDANGDNYPKGNFIDSKKFIKEYNTNNLVLYAIWDLKFKVTFDYGDGNVVVEEAIMDKYNNNYIITFPEAPQPGRPGAPKFLGWTGGFLNDSICNEIRYELRYDPNYYLKPESFWYVRAEYQEQYLIKFEVNTDIAAVVRGGFIGEGEEIPQLDVKLNPRIRDENYKFVRYELVTSDGRRVNIGDLHDFRAADEYVTQVRPNGDKWIVFEAVFIDKEGNEVR